MMDTQPAQHVMLDIETWGTGVNAAIISIGACVFDPNTGAIGSSFYVAIDPHDGLFAQRKIDPATILWWMHPDRTEAREEWLNCEKCDIFSALDGFAAWFPAGAQVWGNGAEFDNAIMSHAFAQYGIASPWDFWNSRCYRTLKSLAPAIVINRGGMTYHNALDDALAQAEHMHRVCQHLGITP